MTRATFETSNLTRFYSERASNIEYSNGYKKVLEGTLIGNPLTGSIFFDVEIYLSIDDLYDTDVTNKLVKIKHRTKGTTYINVLGDFTFNQSKETMTHVSNNTSNNAPLIGRRFRCGSKDETIHRVVYITGEHVYSEDKGEMTRYSIEDLQFLPEIGSGPDKVTVDVRPPFGRERISMSVEDAEALGKVPFKIGDVVRLRSGSPAMTITAINSTTNSTTIGVMWINGGEINSLILPPGAVFLSKT